MTRRTFGGVVAAAAASTALVGCDPATQGGAPASPGGSRPATAVPGYFPYDGAQPDLPGDNSGTPPAFFHYPSPAVDWPGFPLTGVEPFTALVQGPAPATPIKNNKCYTALTTSLGTTFDLIYGGYTEYTDKFQVTIASNDLPDMCMIVGVAQLPKLLSTKFADLTGHLAGDAIRDYPGLGNIPAPSWKVPTVDGRLWGIPQPRPPAGIVLTARGDLLESRAGISDPFVKLRDGKDLVQLLATLTNRSRNEFAMGADPRDWLLPILLTMAEAPNKWAQDGGTFVSEIASEQMKEALARCGEIVQAGHLHPNSFSDPGSNTTWFNGGITSLMAQNFTNWGNLARQHPEFRLGNVELPTWGGGGPAPIRKSLAGFDSFVAFKKAPDERIQQLLRVANYIAAPFGTTQHLEVGYGVEGYTYEVRGGNPVAIPKSPGIIGGITYAGTNKSMVLFVPGQDELVRAQHDYLSRALPAGRSNAAEGLYSETAVTKGATFDSRLRDAQREVILGNQPMAHWDDVVAVWRRQVGDAMATEYAAAAATR